MLTINTTTFFRSSQFAVKDWTFVNRHGVHIYPKRVAKFQSKKIEIEISIGNYFGLYDYSLHVVIGTSRSGSLPSAVSAQMYPCTSERQAVLDAIEELKEVLSAYEKDAAVRDFYAWAHDFTTPQLTIFLK